MVGEVLWGSWHAMLETLENIVTSLNFKVKDACELNPFHPGQNELNRQNDKAQDRFPKKLSFFSLFFFSLPKRL